MIDLGATVAVAFCAVILTVAMLLLALGSKGLGEVAADCRRTISLSRFGLRHIFATTAILGTVMALLRVLDLLESWLNCLVVGACFAPFAVGIVYFVALVFADFADTLSTLRPAGRRADDESDDEPARPNDE